MDLKCNTPADVLKAAKDHKVKMVDVKFVDMPGMSINLTSTILTLWSFAAFNTSTGVLHFKSIMLTSKKSIVNF